MTLENLCWSNSFYERLEKHQIWSWYISEWTKTLTHTEGQLKARHETQRNKVERFKLHERTVLASTLTWSWSMFGSWISSMRQLSLIVSRWHVSANHSSSRHSVSPSSPDKHLSWVTHSFSSFKLTGLVPLIKAGEKSSTKIPRWITRWSTTN